MSLKDNALITLERVKAYLAIDKDDYNELLEMLINSISSDLEKRLGWSLVYASYSGSKLSGTGEKRLFLPARPIWDITALTESAVALVKNTDYVIEDAGSHLSYLRKIVDAQTTENDLVWARGIKNITISYTAGWWVAEDPENDDGATEMPDDIQMGAAMQVGLMRKRFGAEDWDIESQAFPDGSISRNITGFHPLYKEIINKYRRILL